MGLRTLFKNYPIFMVLALLALASCRSGFNLTGQPRTEQELEDLEQKQMAREFKKLERKAATRARKEIWRAEKRERLASGNTTTKTKIKVKSGRVAKTKRSKKAQDPKIEKVISTARSYYGTPYRYGGNTRIGIDCSGLLCQSFSAVNYQLPRTSAQQSQVGATVRPKDLQKGDLVFFSASRGSRQITHVGMVTEVKKPNEEVIFIHASTRLGVIEDNLYAGYWNNLFVKAVRPKL
ncbi:MAG TPA: C40 family peptidase [Adhaeribacter sp.]|nr:C40 family peptidase [Adhaeribacter sp.]